MTFAVKWMLPVIPPAPTTPCILPTARVLVLIKLAPVINPPPLLADIAFAVNVPRTVKFVVTIMLPAVIFPVVTIELLPKMFMKCVTFELVYVVPCGFTATYANMLERTLALEYHKLPDAGFSITFPVYRLVQMLAVTLLRAISLFENNSNPLIIKLFVVKVFVTEILPVLPSITILLVAPPTITLLLITTLPLKRLILPAAVMLRLDVDVIAPVPVPSCIKLLAITLPAVILPVVLIMLLPKLTNAAATFETPATELNDRYSKTFARTLLFVKYKLPDVSITLAVVNPTTFAAYNPVHVVAEIIFVLIKLAPTINPPPFPIIVFAKILPAKILPVVLIMLLPKLTNAAATFEVV